MKHNTIADRVEGLATLTLRGGVSPLRTGNIATIYPFTVSKEGLLLLPKEGGEPAKKANKMPEFQFVKTVLRHCSFDPFNTIASPKTIEETTGKKSTWSPKGSRPPALSQIEILACNLAETAYSSFGTTRGVIAEITIEGELLRFVF